MTELDDPYALPVRTGDRYPTMRESLLARSMIERLGDVHHPNLEAAANPAELPPHLAEPWGDVEDSLTDLYGTLPNIGQTSAEVLLKRSVGYRKSVDRFVAVRGRRMWIHGVSGSLIFMIDTSLGQVITHGRFVEWILPMTMMPSLPLLISASDLYWNEILDLYRCQYRIGETISRLIVLINRPWPLA